MTVETTREFFQHFGIMGLIMAVGALRNLAMLFMAFGAGNSGMFAWGGCPDIIDLVMAGAACSLGSGLIGDFQRPVYGMA